MSEVKTIIRAIDFHPEEKLEEFATNRVQKLGKLSDSIIEAEVYLKKTNHSVENKEAEIRLAIPGHDLFAKKSSATFEDAIDQSVEALRRQLKKKKEKVWGIQ